MRKCTVIEQQVSQCHILIVYAAASDIEINKFSAGISITEIKWKSFSLNFKVRKQHCYLVRNAHAVAKRNRPLTDSQCLAELDKAKNLNVGDTYLNGKTGLIFIQAISKYTRSDMIAHLKQTPLFTFIMNDSTGVSGDEQDNMFIRFFTRGNIYTHFINQHSPASTCPSDLYEHVKPKFLLFSIDDLVGKGILFGIVPCNKYLTSWKILIVWSMS